MADHIKFFNAAIRLLKIGTTQDEFAKNYANASGVDSNSSIWNEYYKKGIEEYSTINLDGVDGISEKEYNKIEYLIERLTPKGIQNLSFENFAGNKFIEGIRSKLLPKESDSSVKTDEEQQNLKPVVLMSDDEVIAEIRMLEPDFDLENNDIKVLRKTLDELRKRQNTYDKNSDVIDYNIGSFNQGSFGTCTILASVNKLTESQLKTMIEEGEQNGVEGYFVTFPMDMELDENSNYAKTKTQFISKEELSSGTIEIQGISISGFSTGDLDVQLIEMAYAKRFGVDPMLNGADLKFAREIFAFPEDNYRPITNQSTTSEDYQITEDKLMAANKEGEHVVVALKHAKNLPDDFSYTEGLTSEYSDMTASWKFSKFDKMMLRRHLEMDPEKFEKFEAMSNGEQMDIANRFISTEYGFTGELMLSNGVSISENHAYSVISYNPETKIVTLSNPHANNENIEIPLDIAQKFFDISI